MSSPDPDSEALLIGLLDDPEFQKLSERESKFNIFEALGTRKQEIRHSDFLSYVLDPSRPHGLGDRFLRDFLLQATDNTDPPAPFGAISLRLMPLDDVVVDRERHHIDVLVEAPGRWVVLIENKIDAGEHGDQLIRYRQLIHERLSSVPALLLYLTPDGAAPSDSEWTPISHTLIRDVANKWATNEGVPDRTRYALSDYKDFLEGHILEDTKTAELCRSIYRKHREAIDLLVEHIPSPKDVVLEAAQLVMEKLSAEGVIEPDSRYHKVNRFIDPELKPKIPDVIPTTNWTNSGKGVLFEWEVTAQHVRIDLVVGPIEPVKREYLLDLMKQDSSMMYEYARKETKSFSHAARHPVVDLKDFSDSPEDIETDALVGRLEHEVRQILETHRSVLERLLDHLEERPEPLESK